jgi:hypothetical protein
MTLIGRDRPKSYERGVDNAAISADLRPQTGEWAVHLENVGLLFFTAALSFAPRQSMVKVRQKVKL